MAKERLKSPRLRAFVALELPPTRSRTLDFLNEGTGFFALHSPEAIRLVNRSHIRFVTPLD